MQRKTEGKSLVRVHFLDQHWAMVLEEPGTEVALELVSRWPSGVPFEKTPRADHRPATDVYLLLLKGRVLLGNGSDQRTLRAPVVYQWNAGQGALGPVPLKKLPPWVDAEGTVTPPQRAQIQAAEALGRKLTGSDVSTTLRAILASDNAEARGLAVHSAGATDDLPLLLAALRDAKHADVRATAVTALRNWIGRGAGQDQLLYQALVNGDYGAGQAETILQLLHTFSAQDRLRPETFETLIDYLNHDKIAIRELAYWHLTRMVPRGRDIAYNAAAGADEHARAQAVWRKLLPAGKVPPVVPK